MTEPKNPLSIRGRLKHQADVLGLDFQTAIQYYAIERFLYRLSMTSWGERFVIKGATMLRVWDGAIARPTQDVDMLSRVPNTPDEIRKIVAECLAIEVDDGLVFSDVIEVTEITVEDRYPGARVKTAGSLAGARFVLRLDVGIGDATVPEPGWVDYPTLLGGPAPRILAYQPETAIAEKIHAIVEKGVTNSRLKDYYDIWMLSRVRDFDGATLAAALRATFDGRDTAIPATLPEGLSDLFASDPASIARWEAYRARLAKAGVEAPADLRDLVHELARFAMPSLKAAAAERTSGLRWLAGSGWNGSDERGA